MQRLEADEDIRVGYQDIETLSPEQDEAIAEMKEQIDTFLDALKTESASKAKAIVMSKLIYVKK